MGGLHCQLFLHVQHGCAFGKLHLVNLEEEDLRSSARLLGRAFGSVGNLECVVLLPLTAVLPIFATLIIRSRSGALLLKARPPTCTIA